MKTLTDEQKRERRKLLDSFIQKIEEDDMKLGLPPTKWVNKQGTYEVSLRRPTNASTTSSEAEKPISQMSQEEFKEKAVKLLMQKYGYSRERAEAAVNSPY